MARRTLMVLEMVRTEDCDVIDISTMEELSELKDRKIIGTWVSLRGIVLTIVKDEISDNDLKKSKAKLSVLGIKDENTQQELINDMIESKLNKNELADKFRIARTTFNTNLYKSLEKFLFRKFIISKSVIDEVMKECETENRTCVYIADKLMIGVTGLNTHILKAKNIIKDWREGNATIEEAMIAARINIDDKEFFHEIFGYREEVLEEIPEEISEEISEEAVETGEWTEEEIALKDKELKFIAHMSNEYGEEFINECVQRIYNDKSKSLYDIKPSDIDTLIKNLKISRLEKFIQDDDVELNIKSVVYDSVYKIIEYHLMKKCRYEKIISELILEIENLKKKLNLSS